MDIREYISYIVQILVQNDQGDLVIKFTSETKKIVG